MPTLDELETFVCIARCGGFSEASRRLSRSQPAISRRVTQLEDQLAAALFVRKGRRVSLTEAGRALLPHAETALAAVRDGEQAVQDAKSTETKRALKVAIVGTLADSHLVAALHRFEARFPDVSIDLTTATSREVSALVRDGEVHLGLRYYPDADARLTSHRIGSDKLLLVVSAKHPLRQKRLRSLSRLRGERFLGFAPERGQPDSFGRTLQRALAEAGFPEPYYTKVDSLTAQKRLVEAGLGVALMPLSSVREELRIGSLRAIALLGMGLHQPIVLVQRRGGYEHPLAAEFTKLLRSAVRKSVVPRPAASRRSRAS